ncbi:mevalonate kinase [Cardiobacteriaceae bacterium TAE3-ERU3]|nr:mevalonate kinase [Cardiobacteriaceae bacterium TAE3-ERU3]
MVSGEHAVVYGHAAIVAAIEQRIHVRLQATNDDTVYIHSALGEYQSPVMMLRPDPRLRFAIACLERYPHSGGVDISINSDIDHTLGLGSSAAVTIALLGALARHSNSDESLATLHTQALTIIRSLQGRGSGADLAASLHGGMIAYRNLPHTQTKALPLPPTAFHLRYAGYKTPTAEVLALIAARMADEPEHYEQLYQDMGKCSAAAITAAQQHNWATFYQQLNRYQQLMRELGVSDDTLEHIITSAHEHSDCHAAKISGSGLGDCVLALANTTPTNFSAAPIAEDGLIYHD